MRARNRESVTDSITFLSLAEAADIPGKHRVSEAHTILIHLEQGHKLLRGTMGKQEKQKQSKLKLQHTR